MQLSLEKDFDPNAKRSVARRSQLIYKLRHFATLMSDFEKAFKARHSNQLSDPERKALYKFKKVSEEFLEIGGELVQHMDYKDIEILLEGVKISDD